MKEVWFLSNNNILICSTFVADGPFFSAIEETDPQAIGKTCYDSRAELIRAQIKYWLDMDKISLEEYVDQKVREKHKTCLTDDFDNGYFWAMKGVQEFIKKSKNEVNTRVHEQ